MSTTSANTGASPGTLRHTHAFNAQEELLDTPLPEEEDSEAITVPLGIIPRTVQRIESYLRAQCHLQNFWIISHMVTILGTLLNAFSLVGDNIHLQRHSYSFTTWGTIVTYIIVLYRCYFEEQMIVNEEKEEVILKPSVMSVSEFMKNENAQLLGYTSLWLFTNPNIVKLVPFAIYSIINLSSFFTLELIPDSPFSNALLPLLNYFEIPLLTLASHFDLVAIVLLIRESLLYNNGYPLVTYLVIWLLRYENSEISRSSIKFFVNTLDELMLLSIVPKRIQDEYTMGRQYFTFMIPCKQSLPLPQANKNHNEEEEREEEYGDDDASTGYIVEDGHPSKSF